MSALAIVLLLASAALHAGWNAFGKGRCASLVFFALAELAIAVCLLPVWPWAIHHLTDVPSSTLSLIALSSAFQGLYYLGLSRAYAAGDLGIAYPLIRSLPLVLLAMISGLTGATALSTLGVTGILLTAVGAWLVSRSPHAATSGGLRMQARAIAITVTTIVAYTAIDAQSLPAIRAAAGIGPFATALAVIPFMALGNGLSALAACLAVPQERRRLSELRDPTLLRAALMAGLGIWGSYGLALAAMAIGAPATVVSALRLVSVPLGVVIAVLRFGEPLSPKRIAGIAGLAAGVLLTSWH